MGVDLLYQGEFLADGRPPARQRWLQGEEGYCGWTCCYNPPLATRRVHDILAVVEAHRREPVEKAGGAPIDLIARGPAAAWAAAAMVQSRGAVSRAALDTAGFRFASMNDVYDVNFLPGAVKYGDVPGLVALAAPTPLWLAGEGDSPPAVVAAAYRAAGAADGLTSARPDGAKPALGDAIEWLLQQQ